MTTVNSSMNRQAQLWQAGPQGSVYGDAASSHNKSLSMHRWAKWIAGFSGEFARNAIIHLLPAAQHPTKSARSGFVVLDPFAGVGTTLVEANRLGLDSIGFEINPFASMVCQVKLGSADIPLEDLKASLDGYEIFINGTDGLVPHSSPPSGFKSRIPFFSPAIERKVLFTLDFLNELRPQIRDIFSVALASVMVEFSNYTYEPSLGSRPGAGKPLIHDAPVDRIILAKLQDMVHDIAEYRDTAANGASKPCWRVHECSFFDAEQHLGRSSVDIVVTSPPYMNNYHYVRNSRPQMFWSGLVQTSSELQRLEIGNFGKFWQTVRADDPLPLNPKLPLLEKEIGEIRLINSDRRVYGGNGWANYITTYMNDLERFCQLLNIVLKPGGTAVVVVGNSIVQGKEFKVEERLRDIAELCGLRVPEVTKLRERVGSSIINSGPRLRTESKSALYDAAVVLRRPI